MSQIKDMQTEETVRWHGIFFAGQGFDLFPSSPPLGRWFKQVCKHLLILRLALPTSTYVGNGVTVDVLIQNAYEHRVGLIYDKV